MSIKRFVVAVVILGIVGGTASARAEESYARKGMYMSAGGFYGFENFGFGGYEGSGGYDLRGGYRIHEMFALEGEWQHFTSFDTERAGKQDLEEYTLTLNGKFFPLAGRAQPYALVGMGWFHGQADTVANTYHGGSLSSRFGLGLDFYCTETIGLEFEAAYVLPMTGQPGNHDFDVIPLGGSVFYRFK